jgi:hypothetical protein
MDGHFAALLAMTGGGVRSPLPRTATFEALLPGLAMGEKDV